MRDLFVDVFLEVPVREVARMLDPSQELYERMRVSADRLCEEKGARLRTDRAPEVHMREGRHPLLGDMTLVSSRWAALVPDSVVT